MIIPENIPQAATNLSPYFDPRKTHNLLKGISISRRSVSINHSMFANDTIFFFQTDKTCNNSKIHIGLVFPTIKASSQFQQVRNIVHPNTNPNT